MGSGSFGINRYGVNIQQRNTLEVSNTETVMADNEELYHSPPQDIYNLFAAADLPSCSSSDSANYNCAWLRAKVIRSSILSAWGCPYSCSRVLYIAPNHK